MLWGTIKSFLDPETASKIHVWLFIVMILSYYVVFGLYVLILTNLFHIKVLGNKYQTKLLEIIDDRLGSQILLTGFLFGFHPNVSLFHVFSELPEFLGGKCRCEEYGGCLKSNKGPWKDPEIVKVFS
jgi:hypothetical protein